MTARPATAPDGRLDDRPASLGRRFLAVLVDQVVLLVLGGGVVLVAALRASAALRDGAAAPDAPAVPVPLLLAAVVLATVVTVAQWLAHGRLGWTLGRRLVGVRTVDVHSRRPVGAGRVLVRGLVVAAGTLVCAVGQYVVLLSPLLDRTGRRRGWHDRAVDAEVLRVTTSSRRGQGAHRHVAGTDAAPAGAAAGERPVPERPAVVATAVRGPQAPEVPTPVASALATPAGGLVLAPLHPQRSAPDLDTRAIPAVRSAPTLAFGLAPELETTRPAAPRTDVIPEPRPEPTPGLRVAFDDGRVLTVERLALVGRNPSPGPGLQVVRVADPTRSVSKTHLQLAVDSAGGAWVVDRGSTNGTLVTLPDGGQVVCPVDHPVRLREGAVVVFGDRSLRVVTMPVVTQGRSPVA
ncbi:FHA domain-containing protein [Cellulomonas dongxiuzhuiae]|uniref:RDD family protein n=1 Tax=Cellulomonas dongxiuzhuiae TaxID=2819979 RepID=A0ABX8GGP8_9CELL|nr:FHA domain-containing protein [Cellulomonas dongxiuzhuiae]MBO3093800.1 RDD family protein [Cellulomonas dongxiuzhuiae]QWC14902.1 RDD family protein [Cellulomonas dongxiuzhuiae]